MKRHITLTGLLLLIAAIAPAADLTGIWAGSFKFNDQDVPIRVALKGDSEITGTVDGLPSGTAQIKEGKLQGDNLTFWITVEYQGNPVKLVYKSKVAGDEIKFEFGTEDGSWGTQFTAKKAFGIGASCRCHNKTIRPAGCAPEAADVRGGIPFSVLALTVTPKSTSSSAPLSTSMSHPEAATG